MRTRSGQAYNEEISRCHIERGKLYLAISYYGIRMRFEIEEITPTFTYHKNIRAGEGYIVISVQINDDATSATYDVKYEYDWQRTSSNTRQWYADADNIYNHPSGSFNISTRGIGSFLRLVSGTRYP